MILLCKNVSKNIIFVQILIKYLIFTHIQNYHLLRKIEWLVLIGEKDSMKLRVKNCKNCKYLSCPSDIQLRSIEQCIHWKRKPNPTKTIGIDELRVESCTKETHQAKTFYRNYPLYYDIYTDIAKWFNSVLKDKKATIKVEVIIHE